MGADKVVGSFSEAVADIEDGASLVVGCFGLCGVPEKSIAALAEKGSRELIVVSNNCGVDDFGLGLLLANGQIAKMVASYVGENSIFERLYMSGELEVELVPQGTLAERMRAAGAGIPAFFTPTGVGTVVEDGKETREIDGRRYLLEKALPGDVALVRANVCDRFGNVRFWRTGRNFNPVMASAAKLSIVECDQLVHNGTIDPDDVHLPGIYVHRIVHVPEHENAFEFRTVRKRG